MFKITSDSLSTFRGVASAISSLAKSISDLFQRTGEIEDRINTIRGVSLPVSIENGGTGQTTPTAAFDALAPTTTAGDIIYHNGTDNVRLAIGAEGEVLTVVSGVPDWSASGSSGASLGLVLMTHKGFVRR